MTEAEMLTEWDDTPPFVAGEDLESLLELVERVLEDPHGQRS